MPARRERAKAGTPSLKEYGPDEVRVIIDGAWRIREGEVVVPRAHIEKLIKEVERLTERCEGLTKAVRQNYSIKNAEIKRLRGALEKIATPGCIDRPDIARAALEGNNERSRQGDSSDTGSAGGDRDPDGSGVADTRVDEQRWYYEQGYMAGQTAADIKGKR